MDSERFDRLTKSLATPATRRGLLHRLGTVPLAGILATLLGDASDATAKKRKQQTDDDHGSSHRRHRRKASHRHQTGDHKEHRKGKRKGKRKDKDTGDNQDTGTAACTKRTCPPGNCTTQSNGCGGTINCGCAANQLCDGGTCRTCTVTGGGSALATAVGAAADGDILFVCAGTYTGGFTVSKTITIVGAWQGTDGTIIQGGLPVVLIDAGTAAQPVILERVRLQNGGTGVSFSNNGRALTMRDSTVRGMTPGGGIQNSATLVLERCTLEDNSWPDNVGGGIYNGGGSATLTDCLLQGNSAIRGGGIFMDFGNVTLSGTRVTNNTATGTAGGIPRQGSGIEKKQGTLTLHPGSTICANNPTDLQCEGFSDPAACTETCPAP